ncbi:MAG TPA: hypothetical protein DDW90_09660 [Cyanobacteria bacterium UBA9971]|nr:hypothetical protein [Cyanobacteria bacterium UBA9971]
MMINNTFYKATAAIESNTVANRGILDIGGWLAPNVLMANNKDERKERLNKHGGYFLLAVLSPFVFMPLANRSSLKLLGVTKNLFGKESHIIQLSKKKLANNAGEMVKGIEELGKKGIENLFGKKIKIEKEFKAILNRFPDKEELRKKLIAAQKFQFMADFIPLGFIAGSIPWMTNDITKKQTGRSGFTAEFEMADKQYTEKMAEKHEKTKHKKMLAACAITLGNTLLIPTIVAKSLTTKTPGSFASVIKRNAHLFDYTKGIFVSLLPYFLIDVFADIPHWILASRDKHEMKDTSVRFGVALSIFFGGDYLLNNVVGRGLDRWRGTKLMNDDNFKNAGFFKKFLMPVNKFDKIKELEKVPENILKRTQKYAVGMYWGNMLAIMLALGFGTPYVLNKILKANIKNDMNNDKNDSHTTKALKNFKTFIEQNDINSSNLLIKFKCT